MEKLFNKPLQVNMRCKDCEDRKANIRVSIELQPTTSSVHKTELLLRLTDDADPYFLFSLSISEEDFQSLKVQQGLLISFNEFPQKFIDLLNLCKQESDSDNPRFLLQLSQSPVLDSSAEFSVVETNAFKRLNHLTLRLLQGSDTDIKKHLAVCLSSMKEEKHSFEEKLKKTEDELSYALQKLTEKTRELDKLRAEWTSQEKTISSHYSQDLVSEREKALEIQTRLQQQTEDLRQDLESTHKRSIQQLQTRLAELETSNRELTERKYKNESTIRDLQIKLVGAEEEAQRAKQQVLSLRRENGTLDTECHEKERLVSQLQMRTAVLEQEVKDKDQLMCRTKELLEATQQQKDSIDGNAAKLEETVKLLSADIIKANEIIKKYMGEVQKLSNKNKMKNIVTVEQEKVLLKTEEELQIVTKDLENAQQQLKHKDEQVSKLKEQLETTIQKLNESKEVLKTNENVINWLNKQLNEKLLCRKPPSPSPESFQTPSVLPTAAGLRAHFYPMSGKSGMSPMEAINVIPIEQHPINILNKQSGEPVGLDSKYFERRDDSIPLHGLLPNLQNRELPQRPSKHTSSSAFFTG